jgi:hypothetical protein
MGLMGGMGLMGERTDARAMGSEDENEDEEEEDRARREFPSVNV